MNTQFLITSEQAADHVFNCSLRQFHNLRKAVGFPAPVLVAPRIVRWVRTELETYAVSALPRTAGDEPPQLIAARAAKAATKPEPSL